MNLNASDISTAPPQDAPLFIVDVCDTLYAVNTTTAFIDAFVREHRPERIPRLSRIQAVLAHRNAARALALISRAVGHDIARARLLNLLAGVPHDELREAARAWVAGPLASHRIPSTWALLDAAQARGDEIVLASASIDPVIDAIAEAAGSLPHVSSSLAWDAASRATGRLREDLSGRKAEALAPWLKPNRHLTVLSDNLSDASLMRRADRALVVLPDGRRKNRWKLALRGHPWEAIVVPTPSPNASGAP